MNKEIKLLEDNLINKIAAGEVIERPASIVKELIENSIDALATEIVIEIKNGGISFIKITDNGTGIKKEQIKTAFLRHSTSKISNEKDLDTISTLGFRGEALASIASIAKVTLITKTKDDTLGTKFVIEGGKFIKQEEKETLVGTTFIIQDVFFNIPVRRKFLKKASVEGTYISEIVNRLALGHKEISFKYINNNSIIMNTFATDDIKKTVLNIYGKEIAKKMVYLQEEKEGYKLTGLIALPEMSRGNRNYQNFFLDGRYIKSDVIKKAIEEAYGDRIMINKFPIYVLNLDRGQNIVDVNVHPTKLEVRFEDDIFIFEFIKNAVLKVLKEQVLIPEVSLTKPITPIKKQKIDNIEQTTIKAQNAQQPIQEDLQEGLIEEDVLYDYLFNNKDFDLKNIDKHKKDINTFDNNKEDFAKNFTYDAALDDNKEDFPKNFTYDTALDNNKEDFPKNFTYDAAFDNKQKDFVENFTYDTNNNAYNNNSDNTTFGAFLVKEEPFSPTDKDDLNNITKYGENNKQDNNKNNNFKRNDFFKDYKIVGQFFNTYWLVEQNNEIFLIDQHSAHEKIIYEQYIKSFKEQKIAKQRLFEPFVINVSENEKIAIEQNFNLLSEFGFTIEQLEPSLYCVSEVPFIFKSPVEPKFFIEVLDIIMDKDISNIYDLKIEKIISMSCKKAVKANNRLSYIEAKALIEQLLTLENPFNCPHGRPTIIKMTKYEIEKLFKRVQN